MIHIIFHDPIATLDYILVVLTLNGVKTQLLPSYDVLASYYIHAFLDFYVGKIIVKYKLAWCHLHQIHSITIHNNF